MGVLSWGTGMQWMIVVKCGEHAGALGCGLRAPFVPTQAAASKCLYGAILSSLGNKITFLPGSPFILALLIFGLIP